MCKLSASFGGHAPGTVCICCPCMARHPSSIPARSACLPPPPELLLSLLGTHLEQGLHLGDAGGAAHLRAQVAMPGPVAQGQTFAIWLASQFGMRVEPQGGRESRLHAGSQNANHIRLGCACVAVPPAASHSDQSILTSTTSCTSLLSMRESLSTRCCKGMEEREGVSEQYACCRTCTHTQQLIQGRSRRIHSSRALSGEQANRSMRSPGQRALEQPQASSELQAACKNALPKPHSPPAPCTW